MIFDGSIRFRDYSRCRTRRTPESLHVSLYLFGFFHVECWFVGN